NEVVPWVGERVFDIEVSVGRTYGSGDATYSYMQVFSTLVLALAGTGLWSLLDWRRLHYARLYQWARGYGRIAPALTMHSYGAAKVSRSQFPPPSLERLALPMGHGSPMGLLWSFMGASAEYSLFTGLAEVLGGLLLTARRTTLLGALVCIGVMANVVMLNFC